MRHALANERRLQILSPRSSWRARTRASSRSLVALISAFSLAQVCAFLQGFCWLLARVRVAPCRPSIALARVRAGRSSKVLRSPACASIRLPGSLFSKCARSRASLAALGSISLARVRSSGSRGGSFYSFACEAFIFSLARVRARRSLGVTSCIRRSFACVRKKNRQAALARVRARQPGRPQY